MKVVDGAAEYMEKVKQRKIAEKNKCKHASYLKVLYGDAYYCRKALDLGSGNEMCTKEDSKNCAVYRS